MTDDANDYTDYAFLTSRINEPETGSEMLVNFLGQHHRDLAFTVGLDFTATGLSHVAELAGLSLIEYDWTSHPIGEQKALQAARVAASSMKHRAAISSEIRSLTKGDLTNTIVTRYADNFNTYLTDLLSAVLKKYPKTAVESDAKVSIQDVLQHDSLDDFREWLIDRKVTDLSYQGLPKLEEYWKNKFGFDLVIESEARSRLSFLLAALNLITHRRAIIDRRFISAVGQRFGTLGQSIEIPRKVAGLLLCNAVETVISIDARATSKFKIVRQTVNPDKIGTMHRDFLQSVGEVVSGWTDDDVDKLEFPRES